jgi:hypothetical protein
MDTDKVHFLELGAGSKLKCGIEMMVNESGYSHNFKMIRKEVTCFECLKKLKDEK